MDLDAVADELYGLRPEEFTAARNERAAAARSGGDRALADEIGRLRRPSLPAWASNALVRARRDEVGPLVELGEALRTAHRDLDGAQLRDLVHQQRLLIGALSRQAAGLAADAGHPLGPDALREVQDTLRAVLADADAARRWAAGRLTRPLAPAAGFPGAGTPGTATAGAPARPKASAPRGGGERSAPDQRRRRGIDDARRAAEEAEGELKAREAEAADAARQAEESAENVAALRRRVTALAADLDHAEADLGRARTADSTARERAKDTASRAREAGRRARAAAGRLERLAHPDT